VDFLEPLDVSSRKLRFGDQALYWLAQLHFGRFAGIPVKIIWTIVGLAPAVLFLTGLLMWWNRVLRPWLRQNTTAESQLRVCDEAARSNISVRERP
jgi:uncharacterized iron-regulated membrane protein